MIGESEELTDPRPAGTLKKLNSLLGGESGDDWKVGKNGKREISRCRMEERGEERKRLARPETEQKHGEESLESEVAEEVESGAVEGGENEPASRETKDAKVSLANRSSFDKFGTSSRHDGHRDCSD